MLPLTNETNCGVSNQLVRDRRKISLQILTL